MVDPDDKVRFTSIVHRTSPLLLCDKLSVPGKNDVDGNAMLNRCEVGKGAASLEVDGLEVDCPGGGNGYRI
jgi:hypothetical protein